MEQNILEVKRLKVSFRTNNGTVKAVRDISFNLKKGKTLAIVGESGSGKSVTSKVILGISAGNAIIEGGEVLYDGKDIIKLTEEEMCNIRGDKISMIFQDPLSSLNPIVRIGNQITEAMILKNKEKRKRNRHLFNSTLKHLEKNIVAAYLEEGQDVKKEIKGLCKEFNGFNICGIKLENSFNNSFLVTQDLIDDVEDFLFLASKGRKQNVYSFIKQTMRLMKNINDPYYLRKEDAETMNKLSSDLEAILQSLKANKVDKKSIPDEEFVKKIQELEAFLRKLVAQERPNFFRYGYYTMHNEDKLFDVDVKTGNEKALNYLNENFMNDFLKHAKKGVIYSYKAALEAKKNTVEYLNEMKQYFSTPMEDKKTALDNANKAKSIINPSLDYLCLRVDTVAATFPGALKDFVKKYFKAQSENIKDEKRYEKQNAKRETLIARGKKVDWKVAPKKDIDLEDVRKDIESLIIRLLGNYEEFIAHADEIDFDETVVGLIDQFKEQASNVVYKISKKAAKEKAIKLMEEVGIPEPRLRYKQYPFEFSGGMRQRIVIAIALSADPEILICDEPTTALDVTIQAQILELINKIKEERQLSIIFITHDLGVVANMADEIAVMYAGKIVEYGTSEDIFYDPRHPYTWALLSSMPDLDTKEKLEAIPGTPPNMIYPPKGDAFAARNRYAMRIDFEEQPPMFKVSDTHYAATWLLHPNAPKVEIPKIIRERIQRMRGKEANNGK